MKTLESGNYGGLYSANQVSNPGDCTQWFFCTDSKETSGAKVKEWKPAPDFRITKKISTDFYSFSNTGARQSMLTGKDTLRRHLHSTRYNSKWSHSLQADRERRNRSVG